jgi:ABC-type nitrate/sulfonate/bicarbonate transport system substrate-binding protein
MSVVTRKKTIQEDRDTVARMIRAHVEGIHFLKTQKEASLIILAKYLRTNDKELLEGSYEIYKDDFIATPYPITQGLQTTYEYVAQRRPEVFNHKAEEFTDPSFIAEMDKSGFIKKLYGQK